MNAAGVAAACLDHQLTKVNALVPATIYDLVHDEAITRNARSLRPRVRAPQAWPNPPIGVRDQIRKRLVGTYGMTEAPGVVCIEDPAVPHSGSVRQAVAPLAARL